MNTAAPAIGISDLAEGDSRDGLGRTLDHLAEPVQPQQSSQHHEEDVPLQCEEDVPLQCEQDVPLQCEQDVPLQCEEDVPLQCEKDVPLQSQRPDLSSDRSEYGESGADPLASTPEDQQTVRQRPQRLKNQPVVLSYDTLGQPSLVPRNCMVIETQVTQTMGWRPWMAEVF